MTLFFTATLLLSIAGLLTLVGVKRWELSTGNVLWAQVRPGVGRLLERGLVWVEYIAPALLRHFAAKTYHFLQTQTHRLVAWVVLMTERGLERTLHLLRHKTSVPRGEGSGSAFLREVSAHKKQLLRRPRQQNKIYEE